MRLLLTLLIAALCIVFLPGALSLQAQSFVWSQTTVPGKCYGGTIRSMVLHNTLLFAGTEAKGVYRTADKGATWHRVSSGMGMQRVYCLASGGATLYAGTYGGGIFASNNNGDSWKAMNSGLPSQSLVRALIVKGDTLFAGINDAGVYRSTDGGKNWHSSTEGLFVKDSSIKSLAYMNNLLFAATAKGLFVSADWGLDWKLHLAEGTSINDTVFHVQAQDNYLLVMTIRTDFGQRATNHRLIRLERFSDTDWVRKDTLSWTALTADGNPYSSALLVSGDYCYKTVWNQVYRINIKQAQMISKSLGKPDNTPTLTHTQLSAIALIDSSLFVGGDRELGIWRTDSSVIEKWKPVNEGVDAMKISFFSRSVDSNLYAGNSSYLFKSNGAGTSWQSLPNKGGTSWGIGSVCAGAFEGELYIVLSVWGESYTSDDGAHWKTLPVRDISSQNQFPTQTLYRRNTTIFSGTNEDTYFLPNWNSQWSSWIYGVQGVRKMVHTDSVIVFCNRDTNAVWHLSNVYYSDFGWKENLKYNEYTLWQGTDSVNAFTTMDTIIFAATDRGVFRTTDNARTWNLFSNGLEGVRVLSLTTLRGLVVAGTTNGVYVSEDTGKTWHSANRGIEGDMPIVAIAEARGKLFAATYGAIYISDGILPVETTTEKTPWVLSPQPATEYITIRNTDDRHSWDEARIANTVGQTMARFGTEKNADNERQYNISALPNGSYELILYQNGAVVYSGHFVVLH